MTSGAKGHSGSSMLSINYALRPAKSVERKMMCETLRELRAFHPLSAYRYVGFGSAFFTDFILFHRSLGLTDMVSIEHYVAARERVEWNVPYKCIRVVFGDSNRVLPDPERLGWEKPVIVWLDYDYTLDHTVLADVDTFCEKAVRGSVLAVTVAAWDLAPWRAKDTKEQRSSRRRRERFQTMLAKRLGGRPPVVITDADIEEWGTARVYRRIINARIERALSETRAMSRAKQAIAYQQLFNFQYRDSTPMLTVGGIIYDPADDADRLERCRFGSLPFIASGDEPCQITVPPLTFREMRFLDRRLPAEPVPVVEWLPDGFAEQYAAIYRYFPEFVETEAR